MLSYIILVNLILNVDIWYKIRISVFDTFIITKFQQPFGHVLEGVHVSMDFGSLLIEMDRLFLDDLFVSFSD